MARIVNFMLCCFQFFLFYPELFTQFPEVPNSIDSAEKPLGELLVVGRTPEQMFRRDFSEWSLLSGLATGRQSHAAPTFLALWACAMACGKVSGWRWRNCPPGSQRTRARISGWNCASHGAASPAAGTEDRSVCPADETPPWDRGDAKRTGAGAWPQAGAIPQFGERRFEFQPVACRCRKANRSRSFSSPKTLAEKPDPVGQNQCSSLILCQPVDELNRHGAVNSTGAAGQLWLLSPA